jgi:hypothetical protein
MNLKRKQLRRREVAAVKGGIKADHGGGVKVDQRNW